MKKISIFFGIICMIFPGLTFAQISVKGTVKDIQGMPLPGVNVLLKSSTNGTISDTEGQYSINAPSDGILVFSFIGYAPQEVKINGRRQIDVSLLEDVQNLEEALITGALGMKLEEKALGYSVQKISGASLQTVKGVNLATSLTGKVSGLWVRNSTEFNEAPTLNLRGETPLLVIDGVPYGNMSLKNLNQDDIESINVLKGPTAAALYGSRGGGGAVIVTTKRSANSKGLTVSVNSNNMFNAGFLMLPEAQKSYSAGLGSAYSPTDYIWGAKLDNGTMADQWDPIAKEMRNSELRSVGKNNFRDFLVPGLISNNNVSITQTGENGSFRASVSHVYNKGQYPNLKSNNTTFNVSGEMKVGDKFTLNSQIGYNRTTAPQIAGAGYNLQGYIYNILVWMGPEYNLASYKDNYWLTPNVKQNWHYNAWYDNPYLMAYEKLNGIEENKMNASFTATMDLFAGAKLLVRPGFDLYQNNETRRNPPGILSTRGWDASGLYSIAKRNGYSINGDAFVTYNKTIGKLGIDALAGGTIYKFDNNYLLSSTRSGLIIPGYYSLNNSVERPNISVVDPVTEASNPRFRKQVNSILGKLSLSYDNTFFLDATGRNDWSSTMPSNARSYFYPSVGASVVMSEFFNTLPSWLDFWKVRGSWTVAKSDLGIYATNNTYNTATGVWNGLNTASYPGTITDASNVIAETNRTWEIGTAAYFFKKRFKLDVAYFNKYNYNIQTRANISQASGFSSTLINIDQTYVRKGMEITLDANVLKTNDWQWDATANWSYNHRYFKALDPQFSAKNTWTKEGGRTDTYTGAIWMRDPQGNLIHQANGLTQASTYNYLYGYSDPKFIWGLANTVKYKQFTLTAAFDGRIGGYLNNYTSYKMWDTGAHPDSDNQWRYDEVVNKNKSYVGQGVVVTSGTATFDNFGNITSDSREYAPNTTAVSYETYARRYGDGTRGVTNATFIKLREVSIGYALPPSIAKYIGARSASITLTGQNVWMWTKDFRFADPDKADDTQLTSPSARYLGGSIQLTF
jgi:TonB-linked SusC/RagA family outer membrane protein